MKKTLILAFLISALTFSPVDAQVTYNPMTQTPYAIWGHGYDLKSFARFPPDAQAKIPSDVWSQSTRSSGLHVRFKTNATSITVKYGGSASPNGNNWFSIMGANGVDMYARKPDGKWYWCHPSPVTMGSSFTYGSLNTNDPVYTSDGYEFRLYFPLFAATSSISITVNTGANFEFIPVDKTLKPIVIYGTSVVHGAVCSRAGNAWTNIVGRNFSERNIINLGFSGVGRVEPEVIEVINRIDADIFIIDCLPNYSNTSMPALVDPRYKSAIDTLTKYHPNAAILISEHQGYSDMDMWKSRKDLVTSDNIELKKVYNYFKGKGYNNLYYLSMEELGLDMSTDIGDYVHPNDKGMYKYAEVYTTRIAEMLSKISSNVPQQSADAFHIYPNPNKGSFEFTLPEGYQNGTMEIVDMAGKVIYTEAIATSSNKHVVKQIDLSTGNYVLVVNKGSNKLTKSFVIN